MSSAEELQPHTTVCAELEKHCSGLCLKTTIFALQLLRRRFPEYLVVQVSRFDVSLIEYAEAGHAEARVVPEHTSYATRRWCHSEEKVGDIFYFARYEYEWNEIEFII